MALTNFGTSVTNIYQRLKHQLSTTIHDVIEWFQDIVFRRLLRNASWLLGATAIATLLNLIATLYTARILGPAGYGTFVLAMLFVEIVSILVSFQSWQAIVKYGSENVASGDTTSLGQLFKFGYLLDGTSAIVGTIVALAASRVIASLFGWDQSLVTLISIFTWWLLFNIENTPTGILRLYDRFDLLSVVNLSTYSFRLIGVFWAVTSEQDIFGFAIAYLVGGILGKLMLNLICIWQLRRLSITNIHSVSLRGLTARFPGIWDYVWSTNLHATVVMLSRQLDIVLIALIANPAAVGVYKIAKQFARILPLLSDPLYYAIYPELARLWTSKERRRFTSLMNRSTVIVGVLAIALWLAFVLVGQSLIEITLGAEYAASYPVAVIYMLALVISMITFSFQPAMLAFGQPRNSLKAQVLSTSLYFVFLVVLTVRFSIIGSAAAFVVYYIIWTVVMYRYIRLALNAKPSP